MIPSLSVGFYTVISFLLSSGILFAFFYVQGSQTSSSGPLNAPIDSLKFGLLCTAKILTILYHLISRKSTCKYHCGFSVDALIFGDEDFHRNVTKWVQARTTMSLDLVLCFHSIHRILIGCCRWLEDRILSLLRDKNEIL